MTYQEALTGLADDTERRVLAVYAQFVAGTLSRDETEALIASAIAQGNSTGAALADLSLAATLMNELGEAVPTAGAVRPAGELSRLSKAAHTVLDVADASDVPEAILSRLARNEPVNAATDAYADGMKANKRVKGWVRTLEPDACQLCVWWSRDGRVWPAAHPMPRHTGCTCHQTPRVATHIQETIKTRSMHV